MRIPAALCGTVGLKTTVGQVSRAGVFPLELEPGFCRPVDSHGRGCRTGISLSAGQRPHDPATQAFQAQDVLSSLHAGVRGLRLAFAETAFWDQADREVAQAVRACGDVFAGLGAQGQQY